jgi:transcription initiation factor TFIIB
VDYETGEIVCQNCGHVTTSTPIDLGPEWRAFNPIEKETLPRTGSPITWRIPDKGLSTNIGWQYKDAFSKKLNPESRARLYRLRMWNRRSRVTDSRERNLTRALTHMNSLGDKLNLPRRVLETSSLIYRHALQKQLIRGRTIMDIVAASIYMACRQCGVIRSLEDVASVANMSKKEAARNYRLLLGALKPIIPRTDASGYIGKISSNLKLSGDLERLALDIFKEACNLKLTVGRSPVGIAAACVYISGFLTGECLTQDFISKEAQVTEVTIRNRYKELVANLDLEIRV